MRSFRSTGWTSTSRGKEIAYHHTVALSSGGKSGKKANRCLGGVDEVDGVKDHEAPSLSWCILVT